MPKAALDRLIALKAAELQATAELFRQPYRCAHAAAPMDPDIWADQLARLPR